MSAKTGLVSAKASLMAFGGHPPRFDSDNCAVGLCGHGRMGPQQQVVVMIGGALEGHPLYDNILRLSPESASELAEALRSTAGTVLDAHEVRAEPGNASTVVRG